MTDETTTKSGAPRAARCTKEGCGHYASHGERCGQVECPSRKRITAVQTGSTLQMVDSTTSMRRYPSTRTSREYD